MKRRLFFALTAFVCAALFLAAREAASWRPRVLGKVAGANRVSLSPDGQVVLVRSFSYGESTLFNADTGDLLRGLPIAHVHVFSPDSQTIAAVNGDEHLTPDKQNVTYAPIAEFLDVHSGRSIRVLRAPERLTDDSPNDAAFSPDGKRFLIATPRSFLEFDAATGRLLHRAVPQTAFDSSTETIYAHRISPDAKRVVAVDQFARIYNIGTGKIEHSLRLVGAGTQTLGWSPDGNIVWQADEMRLRFWNARTGNLIRESPTGARMLVHFLPDSQTFAVAKGNRLELRDVSTGRTVKTLPGPRFEPFATAPDGTFAVSVENGKMLRWRLK